MKRYIHKKIKLIETLQTLPTLKDPPREIRLSNEDEQIVQQSIDALGRTGLETKLLFDIVQDWQTRRTVTAKRLFASASVVIAAVIWVGADFDKLSFFGFQVGEGSLFRFVAFLSSFIVVTGFMFEFSRRIDLSVRTARISLMEKELRDAGNTVDRVDEIVHRYKVRSANYLLRDFRRHIVRDAPDFSAIHAYDAVKLYREHLKGAGLGLRLIEKIEWVSLYLIAAYAR